MAHPTNDNNNNSKGGNNRKEKSEKTRIHRVDTVEPIGLNASNLHTGQETGPTSLNLHLDELQKKKTHPFITSRAKTTTATDSTPNTSLSTRPTQDNSDGADLSKGPSNLKEPDSSTMDLSAGPDISSNEAREEAGVITKENTTEEASVEAAADGNTQETAGASAGDSKPDPNKASNSGIVAKIMAGVKEDRAKELEAQKDRSNEIVAARKKREEERRKAEGNTNNNASGNQEATASEVASTDTQENDSQQQSGDPMAGLTVEVSSEEQAEMDANAQEEAEGKKLGLMVGRSVGYGARIDSLGDGKEGELKVTPFGETEEEIVKNRDEFRSKHHGEAESKGGPFHTGYVRGYNEGQPQGVRLKQEATQTARQKALEEQAKTPEFQAGAALGTACGTASAKGETQVKASFVVPDGDKGKTIGVQAPLQEVRNKAMDEQQTPNGELKGEAFERGFMQHYNASYGEMSSRSQQSQGPEIDEDYKAGYDNGYKLGKQKAVGGQGDPALEAEKASYEKVTDSSPKSEQQKQSGFYMGYNKGMQDARTKNINDQKAAIKARNEDPTFMAGFATGAMQGFLKAMLLPSGITVAEAIQDDQKLRDGGIPEYFPIPDLVRKYLTLVETGAVTSEHANSADADKATIAQPLFSDGLLLGFNQGYANAERNRGNFQREQYKMHPDYQDAVKPVHQDVDEKGAKIDMTMGHVIAMVHAKVDFLKTKKSLNQTQEEQLSMYETVRERLQAEVDKRSEYYERGVIDYYNFHLPKEAKKLQVGDAYATTQTEEYQDGLMRGEEVGERIVAGKEKLKELHQGGIDISNKRKKFNAAIQACHKQAKKTAQDKGQGYFEGYARGYSSKLEEAANGGKSDGGNQGLDAAAKAAMEQKMGDVKAFLKDMGIDFEVSKGYDNLEDQKKGEKAYKEGAEAGYAALYEQKKSEKGAFNADNAPKIYKEKVLKQHRVHRGTKNDAGQPDEEQAGILTYYYSEGYNLDGKEDDTFGAPKGKSDGSSFVIGYSKGAEKELTKVELRRGAEEEKKKNGSGDAFKAGYHTARKEEGYQKFRSAMIRAVNREETSKELNTVGGPGATSRADAQRAANSTGVTHALTTLEDNREEDKIREQAKQDMDSSGNEYSKTRTQAKGYQDAQRVWGFILGRKYGVPLGDGSEKAVEITQADASGETTISTFDPTNGDQATSIYNDKENFIAGVGRHYARENKIEGTSETKEPPVSIAQIQTDYERGYRLALADLEKKLHGGVVVNWQYDMGYVDGVKQIAPEIEGVNEMEYPSRPILEMGEEQTEANKDGYKQTDGYKKGLGEGIVFGEKLKMGTVNLGDRNTNTSSDQEYQKGQEAGAKQGALDGEKAWEDPCHPGPLDGEITVQGSANYKEGYIKGYLDYYWKKRDFEYGKHLAYQRTELNIDETSDPDPDAIVKDKEAYFRGYNLGRENATVGRSKNSNGQDSKAGKTGFERLRATIKSLTERNAALVAGRELNVLGILSTVANGNDGLLSRFRNLTVVKAAFDFENDTLYTALDMSKKAQVEAEKGVQDYLKELYKQEHPNQKTPEKLSLSDNQHTLIQGMYDKGYQVIYTRALLEFQNLSYIVAMGRSQGHYSGNMSTASQGGTSNPSESNSNQDFQIDDLELVDRFYEVFDIIDDRRYAIEQGLKNIAFYSRLSNMSTAASVAEMQAEIQKLESEMESDAQEGQEEQMEEYQSVLAETNTGKNSPFRWKWEEAEERVFAEFKRLHLSLTDHLSFESPFNTKTGIEETLGVNLSTSADNGQNKDVYKKLGLFNNLEIEGKMEYDRDTNFMMQMIGNVTLNLDEQNEHAKLLSANIRLERSSFQFTATGLEHEGGDFTLFSGRAITPKLEGGPHEGRSLDFEFEDLTLSRGASIKRQVEDQAPALQGG